LIGHNLLRQSLIMEAASLCAVVYLDEYFSTQPPVTNCKKFTLESIFYGVISILQFIFRKAMGMIEDSFLKLLQKVVSLFTLL